jgi:hypothetical protein
MLPGLVLPPRTYFVFPSLTWIRSIDSPRRRGMSRYAPWYAPPIVILSATSSEPFGAALTETPAFGRS